MTDSLTKYRPLKNPATPARIIEGEAVIVSPFDSKLHTLNEVGTFIWERADGSTELDQIVDELCQTFDIDRERARQDAERFVESCLEKQVMLRADEAARLGDDDPAVG